MDSNESDKKTVEQEKAKGGSSDYGASSRENVSFSFNLDLENIAGDLDSNSDGELEIDVSEIDNYESQNSLKRKREIDKDISVFNKMEEEIERQLDAKAARTNLTVKNVKNILKHVITNEHVMAMVKRRAYNLENDIIFEPKLTRAKAKELAMTQPNIPWPITPVKKLKGSEVQVLIEEELFEDSSDEEYHPEQDEPSDDEREIEGNSISSDLDSQPSTPAKSAETQPAADKPRLQIIDDVRYDEAGLFKVPDDPVPVSNESENIGQRTRSKLSLSETPLEQIEQAFLPPDITTDMYDWDWDTDEDWNNFLKDFTQPLTQEIVGEDDPEADPEYNILEDEEGDLLDKEELRMDKAVKVTRKELNNLVAELFEFADMFSKENQDITKKKKSSNVMNSSTENASVNDTMIELLPVLAESSLPKLVNAEQRALLEVQLCQHVQLMVQHFVMTYLHPDLQSQAKTCKDNLNSLRYLSNGENSAFNAENLPKALELVSEWEKQLKDPELRKNYVEFVNYETALGEIGMKNKTKYTFRFHPAIKKIFMESSALMYPQLLPDVPLTYKRRKNSSTPYLASENHLIVLGLDQFVPFVKLKQTKFKEKNMQMTDTAQLISQYLLPTREPSTLFKHIKGLRRSSKRNPIKEWYEIQKVPSLVHCILEVSSSDLKAPREQPVELLPKRWQKMIKGVEDPNEKVVRKRMLKIYRDLLKPSNLDINSNSEEQSSPLKHRINPSLLNPTVNMLPAMPFLNTPLKSTTGTGEKSECRVTATEENLEAQSTNSASEESPCFRSSENPATSTQNEEDGVQSNIESERETGSIAESGEFNISMELETSMRSGLHIGTPTEKKEDISSSTEKIPKRKTLPISEVMFDCTSPKHGNESDEQTNVSADQVNLPNTMEKPQLRKTTPRLAKIRSAQNMKMMAQILGNKGPSPSTAGVKPRGKKGGSKNLSEESLTSNNGDNEEEIAELMLASTTIKKDTAIRKRAKQARELENIKRLVEAENDLSQEERATKFAVSFLQKLHKLLDPNAEVFKTTVKLFLDYNERIDALNQAETEELCHAERLREEKSVCSNAIDEQSSNSRLHIEILDSTERNKVSKDSLTIDLYKDICERLTDYPELHSDFLLFLKPHQAAMIGKSVEHTMLQKMNDFVDIAQIYFAKQPSRLSKVMQAITQLASDTRVDLEKVNSVMGPLLKGHPLVMDTFLQLLPNGKPPESLFASHLFENLTCPPGPQDKAKIYGEDAPELYENIEIPVSTSHEDPYGGENCKCECHNLDDHNLKSRSEHCVSCGTRFLNGRIYLQTSEGLRPAKITFPGGEDEKLDHITRVSLKTAEKFVPVTPTRRRKSSKNSSDQAEAKPSKNSPTKDGDEMDKLLLKSKRFSKISMKSKEHKPSPKLREIDAKISDGNNSGEKKDSMSPIKTKREERAEKREAQAHISRLQRSKIGPNHYSTSSKNPDSDNTDNATQSQTDDTSQDENSASEFGRIDDVEEESKLSTNAEDTEANVSLEKMEVSSDSGSEPSTETQNSLSTRPWTRQEDAILLESIKKEYSENTFVTISEMLGHRTVQQVKERFEVLLSLLEKMA